MDLYWSHGKEVNAIMSLMSKIPIFSQDMRGRVMKAWMGVEIACADKIKLWLTPSAKQRRNPCSGLPAVYPDLSTRHDWLVKKGLCFVCRDRQPG